VLHGTVAPERPSSKPTIRAKARVLPLLHRNFRYIEVRAFVSLGAPFPAIQDCALSKRSHDVREAAKPRDGRECAHEIDVEVGERFGHDRGL
jgi:hypothetical protein